MPHDSIPRRDLELLGWANQLAHVLAVDYASYGVPQADAQALLFLYEDFAAKLHLLSNPHTHTKPAVADKNASRALLRAKARQVVRLVNAQEGLGEGERVRVGLAPRTGRTAIVPAPRVRPVLRVTAQGRVLIRDESNPDRRARPRGTWGAVVLVKIGGDEPVSAKGTEFAALATRGSIQLTLPPGSDGQMLYVLAQYASVRGQTGPLSRVAKVRIAG